MPPGPSPGFGPPTVVTLTAVCLKGLVGFPPGAESARPGSVEATLGPARAPKPALAGKGPVVRAPVRAASLLAVAAGAGASKPPLGPRAVVRPGWPVIVASEIGSPAPLVPGAVVPATAGASEVPPAGRAAPPLGGVSEAALAKIRPVAAALP